MGRFIRVHQESGSHEPCSSGVMFSPKMMIRSQGLTDLDSSGVSFLRQELEPFDLYILIFFPMSFFQFNQVDMAVIPYDLYLNCYGIVTQYVYYQSQNAECPAHFVISSCFLFPLISTFV